MSLLHFLPTTTVLFCALWSTVSAAPKTFDDYSDQEKGMAVWLLVLIIVIPLCISGCAAAGFFYMMRKRNSGGDNQVLVVR